MTHPDSTPAHADPSRPATSTALDPAANAVLDAIGSARAVRRFRPDPVAPELLETLVWAATRAASANNSQPWHVIILTESGPKQRLADSLAGFARWIDALGPPTDRSDAVTRQGARRLLAAMAQVPAIVVIGATNSFPPENPRTSYLWSAVGGATQNLLVAARALGLGAVPTMFHVLEEAAVAAVLGLPDGVRVGAIVPVGWPDVAGGPVARRPLDDVLHWQTWSGAES
jgi:nitroreductase